jgi:uncharacterized Zn-finger protein
MILFFGTRTGNCRIGNLTGIACPFCGQTETLQGRVRQHYIHFFWIPVYKLKPIREVQCRHCKKAYYGNEITLEMTRALEMID